MKNGDYFAIGGIFVDDYSLGSADVAFVQCESLQS